MSAINDEQQNELINNQIISEFSKTLEMFSLNATESQLFVTLYLSDDPMTLDEMKEMLGKSKTSMSTAVRTLLDFNLVERVWIKGVRKDLYQAEKDLYHKFMKTYVNRWLNAIERQKENLSSIKDDLEKESTEHNFTENRIKEAINFHESLETAFLSIQRKNK